MHTYLSIILEIFIYRYMIIGMIWLYIDNIMYLKDIVHTPGSKEIVQVQATTFIVKVFFALDYYPWEFYQSQHFTHQVEKNNGNQYVSVATVPKVKKKTPCQLDRWHTSCFTLQSWDFQMGWSYSNLMVTLQNDTAQRNIGPYMPHYNYMSYGGISSMQNCTRWHIWRWRIASHTGIMDAR